MLDWHNPHRGRRRTDRQPLDGSFRSPPVGDEVNEPGSEYEPGRHRLRQGRPDILATDSNAAFAPASYPWAQHLYQQACADQWAPDQSNLDTDREQWSGSRLSADERVLVQRNLAFFAAASAIVTDRLMTALYLHVGAPECRRFLVRQAFEESLHLHTYRHLVGTLQMDTAGLTRMSGEVATIADKLDWIAPFIASLSEPGFRARGTQPLQTLLRALVAFYAIFDGLFYHVGFIQVLSMGRRGKLPDSSALLQRVLRDKRRHTDFGVELINQIKVEHPTLWSKAFQAELVQQLRRAVELETRYAYDSMPRGVLALNAPMFEEHLRFLANRRCRQVGLDEQYPGATDPFPWLQATPAATPDDDQPPARQDEPEADNRLHWDD
jgi:ribonucleoside-diphosphate reductase beta chain